MRPASPSHWVMLHGLGRDPNRALSGISLQQALALDLDGTAIPPMAMVAADGGGGYWHAHPGDDPMGMVVDELIPLCRDLGLGRAPQRLGVLGISMGAYGGLLFAERHPGMVAALAAISPAVWRSWAEARAANAGAFMSAADFAANDVIDNVAALGSTPVRIASGRDDPFRPGVRALIAALPPGAVVSVSKGCHTDAYWASEQPAALAFLAAHLG